MNRRVFLAAITAVLSSGLLGGDAYSAEEQSYLIVPGKSLGKVTGETTLEDLKKLFGAENVKEVEIPGPEGIDTFHGALVLEGTDREFQVRWDEESRPRKVQFIEIRGSRWKTKEGLSVKSTIEDLEKMNGRVFTVSGFGWDYAGFCNFEGGKMTEDLSIRLDVKGDHHPNELYGDVELKSNMKKLRKAKPFVSRISMMVRDIEE